MSHTYDKFHAIPPDKQTAILNAAMKEFLSGYKKASTDNIIKAAGISKGLLFHYFGTKENLYNYLVDHTIQILTSQYLEKINPKEPDILISIWQMAVLKGEISHAMPSVFDFLTSVFLEGNTTLGTVMAIREKVMADIYRHANLSLFRPDIDPHQAIQIINWTIDGYTKSIAPTAPSHEVGETARANYDRYLAELQAMLDTFRRCFYV